MQLDSFINTMRDYLPNLRGFKVNSVIDILIVSVIVYIFLNWVRQTRAWSLIKGIVVLFLLRSIFEFLNLYIIAWFIEAIADVGLLVFVILFQPEIRKVLEELGKGRLRISPFEQEKNLNKEIVMAIETFSNEKTGALICIEREIPLGDIEKTGIAIDSLVTGQMLINIFVDKTPLHDGAVIIRKNRIAAAACILPVTTADIDKDLGTRHRAAVGLSEVSDAIVLVVSEETGKISVARSGKLLRGVGVEEIYDILQRSNEIAKRRISFLKGDNR